MPPGREPDQKLLQALVRAHAWLSDLANVRTASVEELASKADIHPKVMREALKFGILGPRYRVIYIYWGSRVRIGGLATSLRLKLAKPATRITSDKVDTI